MSNRDRSQWSTLPERGNRKRRGLYLRMYICRFRMRAMRSILRVYFANRRGPFAIDRNSKVPSRVLFSIWRLPFELHSSNVCLISNSEAPSPAIECDSSVNDPRVDVECPILCALCAQGWDSTKADRSGFPNPLNDSRLQNSLRAGAPQFPKRHP